MDPPPVWPMRLALALAEVAGNQGEIPVGAVVVRDGQVLSQAHNLRETTRDPTAHAERLALTLAGRVLGTWRLDRCQLYVTLEPCPMCAGAILLARVSSIIYATADPKAGACRSLYRLLDDRRLNHRTVVHAGVLASEASTLLSQFFLKRRSPSS